MLGWNHHSLIHRLGVEPPQLLLEGKALQNGLLEGRELPKRGKCLQRTLAMAEAKTILRGAWRAIYLPCLAIFLTLGAIALALVGTFVAPFSHIPVITTAHSKLDNWFLLVLIVVPYSLFFASFYVKNRKEGLGKALREDLEIHAITAACSAFAFSFGILGLTVVAIVFILWLIGNIVLEAVLSAVERLRPPRTPAGF
jgi:hypothetical protein